MKLLHILTTSSFLFCGFAVASEIPFPKQQVLENKIIIKENKPVILKDLGPRPGFAGYYLAARHAQTDQDWHAANYYFDIVARKDPGNEDMRRRTMVVSMGAGDLAMAAEYASEVITDVPSDALASLFLSANYLKTEEYKKSLEYLSNMEEGGMQNFAAGILKSWTKAALGQFDINGLKHQPLDSYHAALIGRFLGKEDESLNFIEKTYQKIEQMPSLKLGDAYLVLGKENKAAEIYNSLLKQQRSSALRKRLKFIENKEDKYRPHFIKDFSAIEGAAHAYIDMAKILYAQDSPDSARIFAHIGLNLSPILEDGHIILAKIYSETGQFKQAIHHYREIDPKSRYAVEVQLKISEIQESLGRNSAAILGLQALYSELPERDLIIQIADIQRRAENYAAAIDYYDQAISSFNDDAVTNEYWYLYYIRGMSHERLGDWEKAEADFKKALEYRPNDPFVLNYLAYGWAERNQHLAKALEYLEKAVARRPTDGHIRDSLGWAYYKLGQFEEAIEPLEKAITYLPYDPTINEHLGDAYWQVGRKREALFQWQRALNHIENKKEDISMTKRLEDKLVSGLPVKEPILAAENKTQN